MICGCTPSKLDGSEHKFKAQKCELPKRISYLRTLPQVIDQGETFICVPCSVSAAVNWRLNTQSGNAGEDAAVDLLDIYNIRSNKGNGMSIKDALHHGRKNGYKTKNGRVFINEYQLLPDLESAKEALVLNGPLIGALPAFDNGLGEKFWIPEGPSMGGHAISIIGYTENGFIIRNSWGTVYGDDGYSELPWDETGLLFELWTVI